MQSNASSWKFQVSKWDILISYHRMPHNYHLHLILYPLLSYKFLLAQCLKPHSWPTIAPIVWPWSCCWYLVLRRPKQWNQCTKSPRVYNGTPYIEIYSRGDMNANNTIRLYPPISFQWCNDLTRWRTLTISLISLVTLLPEFNCPSPIASLILNKSIISSSSTPTVAAIFASLWYVLLRVSLATLTSKNSSWWLKSAALNCQNLSGAIFRTAAPASCVRVDDGCQGWICWRKMIWSFCWYFCMTIGFTDV